MKIVSASSTFPKLISKGLVQQVRKSICIFIFLFLVINSFSQNIKRIDGTTIPVDSLQSKIEYLMKAANVSGVAVSVFNDNKPVFSKTFGLANVPEKKPLTQTSVMYAASFAKMVFAYIVMQLV